MASPTDSSPSPSLSHQAGPPPDTSQLSPPKATGFRQFTRKARQATRNSLQQYHGWSGDRLPYHDYVHQLVLAGWDSLKELDTYMMTDAEDENLVISVLDISESPESLEVVRRPDIHSRAALGQFLDEDNRQAVKVRLFMAEQHGNLASGVMEEFGRTLSLDPRFFQWSIRGKHGVAPLSPSQRHRAPFTSIAFWVPAGQTSSDTESEYFRVTIYIQPDEVGDGWTG